MKKAILMVIWGFLNLAQSSAFGGIKSDYEHGTPPNCPLSQTTMLEVSAFLPSADSRTTKGLCEVKANYYSWWDLINESQKPYVIDVDAGLCDQKNFIVHNGKTWTKAELSYIPKISMCGSNPGCHYECVPKVSVSHF